MFTLFQHFADFALVAPPNPTPDQQIARLRNSLPYQAMFACLSNPPDIVIVLLLRRIGNALGNEAL